MKEEQTGLPPKVAKLSRMEIHQEIAAAFGMVAGIMGLVALSACESSILNEELLYC
jgi:hypothetical protein